MNYSRDIQVILNQQNENGGQFWSREDGDIYHPFGHCTIDTLYVLGALGAKQKADPILSEAIKFVLDYQTLEDAFKYAKKSSKLPCVAARILAAFDHLGISTDDSELVTLNWEDIKTRGNSKIKT